ncbi:Transcription elongation factor A protein 2 [Yarrowia sp. C11]|nr:Transcription elongation factor A protein 2 [Yarrowia sp. E02]KAG5369210.1 Transcription elongation factor A protein 2 [Yarrowia sp. C11]
MAKLPTNWKQKYLKSQAEARTKKVSTISPIEVRNGTKKSLQKALAEAADEDEDEENEISTQVANDVEQRLFDLYGISQEYKSAVRTRLVSLKSKNSTIAVELLCGAIEPKAFAEYTVEQLKSDQRKKEEQALKEENLRQATMEKPTKEDINMYKDGRDREKWGVSRSAAAIDDD